MSDSRQSRSKPQSGLPKQKFYVRSGEARWMVLAVDVEVAAMRFIQNALQGSMVSGKQSVTQKLQLINAEALKSLTAKLDSRILISQSGFSKSEAGVFDTAMVVNRWREQIAALEKLIRKS